MFFYISEIILDALSTYAMTLDISTIDFFLLQLMFLCSFYFFYFFFRGGGDGKFIEINFDITFIKVSEEFGLSIFFFFVS